MEQHALTIKAAISGVFAFFTALWGWIGWLVVGWVVCMGLDWVSGSTVGGVKGEWNSDRALEGLKRKGGMVLVVMCGAGADLLLGLLINNIAVIAPAVSLPFTYSVLVCPLVLCWYIVTELGSIAENAAALGAPIPKFLTKILKVMNASIEKAGDGIAPEDEKQYDDDEDDAESIS